MKNSLFNSLFLVNLSVFPWDLCLFCKYTMQDYLYCENSGLERLPDDVGFVPNLKINAKILPYLYFWNPLYCARLCLRAQTDSCMCILRVSLVYFPKNRFIYSLKVIFFILTFLKSI